MEMLRLNNMTKLVQLLLPLFMCFFIIFDDSAADESLSGFFLNSTEATLNSTYFTSTNTSSDATQNSSNLNITVGTMTITDNYLSDNSSTTSSLSNNTKSTSSKLKCFCDICEDSDFMCETNGVCFISQELSHTSNKTIKRCYDNYSYGNYDFPSICTKKYDNRFSVNCCLKDFCNTENILPILKNVTRDKNVKPHLKCACTNCGTSLTCETDGYCALSWQKRDEQYVKSQVCYDSKLFFPPDDPSFCESISSIKNSTDQHKTLCCTEDYCNVHEVSKEEEITAIVVFILIVVIAISIGLYIKCKPRNNTFISLPMSDMRK